LGKEVVVFTLAAVFVCVIYWLAFNTATSPTAQLDEKKWALSVLSAGAAGLVGTSFASKPLAAAARVF
jgi:hypothetical protein